MTPKEKQILSVVAAVAILAGGLVWAAKHRTSPLPKPPHQGEGKEGAQGGGNETADWKTYTSNSMGFELRYPESWNIVSDVGIEVSLQKQLQPPVGYTITISAPSLTIQQLITQYPDFGTVESQTQMTFAGKPATKIHFVGESGFTTDSIYIPRGSANPLVIITSPSVYAETDQILSTFKFLK